MNKDFIRQSVVDFYEFLEDLKIADAIVNRDGIITNWWEKRLQDIYDYSESNKKDFIESVFKLVRAESLKEVCICAAVIADDGYIARGHRHNHCLAVLKDMKKEYHYKPGNHGFITSRNRYVDRKEGYTLQLQAGIPSADKGGYRGGELYSEDLY